MINYESSMYGIFKNFGGGSESVVSSNANTNINISLDLNQLINTLCNISNNSNRNYVEDNLIEPIYFK